MDPDVRARQIDAAWRQHYAERSRPRPDQPRPAVQVGEWESGVVRLYNAAKEYGFIQSPGGDVHVSATTLARAGIATLRVGDRVEFVRGHNPDRPLDFAKAIRFAEENG